MADLVTLGEQGAEETVVQNDIDFILAKIEATEEEITTEETTEVETEVEDIVEDEVEYEDEVNDDEAAIEDAIDDATDEDEEKLFTVSLKGGDEVEVTFEELQKGYLRNRDYTFKTEKLSEERQQLEASNDVEKQRYVEGLQQALNYAQNFDPVLAEAQTLDWQKLAQDDPATYVRKKAEVETRAGQIKQLQDHQADFDRQNIQAIQVEQNKLLQDKIPEWDDAAVRNAELGEMVGALRDYGFSDQELNEIQDHRAFLIVRDAVKYRNMQKTKQSAKKKQVKVAPKVQRPGAATVNKPVSKGANKAALKRARATGKTTDIVDAVLKNLNN